MKKHRQQVKLFIASASFGRCFDGENVGRETQLVKI
jgi:hypothetical protein